MDAEVIVAMFAGPSASSPDHVIGSDSGTADSTMTHATNSVDLGYGSGEITPLTLMARLSRLLDDSQVPEEGRWFLADPRFYEELAAEDPKLMTSDYNQGDGGVRNGLVAAGMIRGFQMYKTSNIAAVSNCTGKCLAGHMSSTATAQSILNIETLRDHDTFGDIVRGLHVYGRQVLRDDAIIAAFYKID